MAQPCHGVPSGDRPPAADAGRGDAVAARRRTGAGFRPGPDQREEAALLRGSQFHVTRDAAARTLGWVLARSSRAAVRLLERTGDRKSVVAGPCVSEWLDLGGRHIINKKNKRT